MAVAVTAPAVGTQVLIESTGHTPGLPSPGRRDGYSPHRAEKARVDEAGDAGRAALVARLAKGR
ncbi:MAG TPA: hypothetical protein VM324_11300 [Egibacteraceae bacterium]|jgi:hypothetical protein|nr:hypothetical protein [Egibacteraceae bacterium]